MSGGIHVPAIEWNLAIGLQTERHARRQMRALARLQPTPRILVLVEARRSLYASYISELRAHTGLAWSGVMQPHEPPRRRNRRGSSVSGHDDEAVVILTSWPMESGDTMLCPFADSWHSARAAVHAAVNVEGTPLHVLATHLQAGAGREVAQARLDSIGMLKEWASRFPSPAIVGGDFNALPGSPAVAGEAGMASAFSDTWNPGGLGAAATYPAWWPALKLDYWFADRSGRVRTVSTSVARSVWLSDHFPLQATFALMP